MKKHGFTLIELSIVLVIIGLIIGGVLVGQELIRAAGIRSTIAQKDKFESGVQAFRLKYGYVPGDMPPSAATQFGLFTFTGVNAGVAGFGDGGGYINDDCVKEALVFWRQLGEANLVEGQYGINGNSAIDSTTGLVTATVTDLAQSIPPAKIGTGNFWCIKSGAIGTLGLKNYFNIKGFTSLITTGLYWARTHNINPADAYNLDSKTDDGLPSAGRVQADGTSEVGAIPCVTSSAYTISGSSGTTPACKMYWVAMF